MLTDKCFDFSEESDLKQKLWEQMLQRTKEAAPIREEVKLESLIEQPKHVSADKSDFTPDALGKARRNEK